MFLITDAQPPKYRQEGANSPAEKNAGKTGTILSEDYAEIVDEEGDYSTPASKYTRVLLIYSNKIIVQNVKK